MHSYIVYCLLCYDPLFLLGMSVVGPLDIKMADTDSTITVLVVEGNYSALHKLGFPYLPLLLCKRLEFNSDKRAGMRSSHLQGYL